MTKTTPITLENYRDGFLIDLSIATQNTNFVGVAARCEIQFDYPPNRATTRLPVSTLAEARTKCLLYIQDNDLSEDEWIGGDVVLSEDGGKTQVAQIAHDGTVYTLNPAFPAQVFNVRHTGSLDITLEAVITPETWMPALEAQREGRVQREGREELEEEEDLCCTRCGKKLSTKRNSGTVWLEMDSNTGDYTDKAVLAENSQGAFPFGEACATAELAENPPHPLQYEVEAANTPNSYVILATKQETNWGVQPDVPVKFSPITSLVDAQNKCLAFITDNHLGADDWNGGEVYHDGQCVVIIAYDGQIFEAENSTDDFPPRISTITISANTDLADLL